jgi:hypothetical protein
MMRRSGIRASHEYQSLLEKRGDIDTTRMRYTTLSVCALLFNWIVLIDTAVQDVMQTSKRKAHLPPDSDTRQKRSKAENTENSTFDDGMALSFL